MQKIVNYCSASGKLKKVILGAILVHNAGALTLVLGFSIVSFGARFLGAEEVGREEESGYRSYIFSFVSFSRSLNSLCGLKRIRTSRDILK